MSATAHEHRRRQTAANEVSTLLLSTKHIEAFIAEARLDCEPTSEGVQSAVETRTDYRELLEVAGRVSVMKFETQKPPRKKASDVSHETKSTDTEIVSPVEGEVVVPADAPREKSKPNAKAKAAKKPAAKKTAAKKPAAKKAKAQ